MVEKLERIGRFTSSNIWKLTVIGTRDMTAQEKVEHKKLFPKSQKRTIDDLNIFGAPALTYIEEKRGERCLGRSLDLGKDSQATVWGKVAEYYCDKFHLGLEYTLESNKTDVHPKYPFWSGSKDFTKEKTAGDIKCFEPKKFFLLSDDLIRVKLKLITFEEFKERQKEVYWQVVSNCIILNKPKGEIIAYMPTEEQIYKIKEELEETNILEKLGIDPWKARFIVENDICNLPYVKNKNYPNFVSYEFEVPADDIIFLTKKVCDAEKLLTNG